MNAVIINFIREVLKNIFSALSIKGGVLGVLYPFSTITIMVIIIMVIKNVTSN